MPWTLSGEMIETCSCHMLCPCWYGVQDLMVMDQGWCASPILFRLRDGTAAGVTLSGLTLALALFFPGPTLDDGHATARLYLEETATADQRSALEPSMPGKRGGPMHILAGLITTWLPTQTTSITVQEANGTIQATVGRVGQIHSQRLTNEAGPPMTRQNVGFAVALPVDQERAELAPSAGPRWADPDLPRQRESKSGAVGTFTWSGS
jgi:hypothetical protein